MDSNKFRQLLSGTLCILQEQQEQIRDLGVALEAAVDALKIMDPRFEAEYDTQRQGSKCAESKASYERVLSIIQLAIADCQEPQKP